MRAGCRSGSKTGEPSGVRRKHQESRLLSAQVGRFSRQIHLKLKTKSATDHFTHYSLNAFKRILTMNLTAFFFVHACLGKRVCAALSKETC